MPEHELNDKRIKKPIVYRVVDIDQDVTTQQIETFKIGKGEIRFNTPNLSSVFLNVAKKELVKAKAIYDKIFTPKVSLKEHFNLDDIETVLVYDYLEHIQTSVIMMCSSVESLTNALIPDDFIFYEKIKGKIKEYKKADIERCMSTTDKLKYVIPKALKIKSPSTFKCWSRYDALVKLRNDIIHTKTTTSKQRKEKNTIINILINTKVFGFINSAKELLKDLNKLIPKQPEYPILFNTEDLEVITISSWDSLEVNQII